MSRRVEFHRLQTIEDVRRERLRIKMEIHRTQYSLEKDMNLISELFSVDFWKELLMSKLSVVTSQLKAGWFTMGHNLISGLLNRFVSKPKSRPCPKIDKDDYDGENELLLIVEEDEDE